MGACDGEIGAAAAASLDTGASGAGLEVGAGELEAC